jgi:hypothetical protein
MDLQADDQSEEETCNSSEEDDSEEWGADDKPGMHWLPSAFGRDFCFKNGWEQLVDQEIQLRIVQAEESLDELRLAIGLKSLLYRTRIRNSKTQSSKTRSYKELLQVNSKIDDYAGRYRCARAALISLGAPTDAIGKFKELLKTDLQVNTDVVEENRVGQRNDTLSWLWRISVEGAAESPLMNESKRHFPYVQYTNLSNEVSRVNWLRAKARYDRWKEDLVLVKNEMMWTLAWFEKQEREWKRRALWAETHRMHGHRCYAEKQVIMWRKMHDTAIAEDSWHSALKS